MIVTLEQWKFFICFQSSDLKLLKQLYDGSPDSLDI